MVYISDLQVDNGSIKEETEDPKTVSGFTDRYPFDSSIGD